jgi:hypothetical protein
MEPDVKINSNMNELKENETTVKGFLVEDWLQENTGTVSR